MSKSRVHNSSLSYNSEYTPPYLSFLSSSAYCSALEKWERGFAAWDTLDRSFHQKRFVRGSQAWASICFLLQGRGGEYILCDLTVLQNVFRIWTMLHSGMCCHVKTLLVFNADRYFGFGFFLTYEGRKFGSFNKRILFTVSSSALTKLCFAEIICYHLFYFCGLPKYDSGCMLWPFNIEASFCTLEQEKMAEFIRLCTYSSCSLFHIWIPKKEDGSHANCAGLR